MSKMLPAADFLNGKNTDKNHPFNTKMVGVFVANDNISQFVSAKADVACLNSSAAVAAVVDVLCICRFYGFQWIEVFTNIY